MSIVDIMKGISVGVNDSQTPVNLIPGTVTSVDPLEIHVHDKLTLTKDFIVIAEHLTRHDRIVSIRYEFPKTWDATTVIGDVVKTATSSRNYIGTAPVTSYEKYEMLNAKLTFEDVLKKDDQVMLIRIQGGQQYYVADRAVNA